MNYSFELLTTKADCQALVDIAAAGKESLAYRKTGLARQRQSATINAASIEAELAAVNAEIQILEMILAGLPEGSFKEETLVKYKKADYKRSFLSSRRGNYGVLSLLEKEYDITCIEKDIAETDAFIAALKLRMDEVN